MKKQLKRKLNLSKQVIGNLSNLLGGVPPPTKWRCERPSTNESIGGNCGFTTDCTAFDC